MTHLHLVGEPPKEDSEDFTEAEANQATITESQNGFVKSLEEAIRPMVRPNVSAAISRHELRRRGDHLYCRTKVLLDGEPDKVLIFRLDWLKEESICPEI